MKRIVRVVGESMAPAYRPSDLLLTRPVGRSGVRVRRGDVAVFRRGGLQLIKRVAGVPGDFLEFEAGRLFVNGVSMDMRPRVRGAVVQSWWVPEDSYFVTGDNGAASTDSRIWDDPFVRHEELNAIVTRRLLKRRHPKVANPTRRPRAARPAA